MELTNFIYENYSWLQFHGLKKKEDTYKTKNIEDILGKYSWSLPILCTNETLLATKKVIRLTIAEIYFI